MLSPDVQIERRGREADALAFVPPQRPVLVDAPPAGPEWQHEVKHDGYRTMLVVDGAGARAFTRRGLDWSDRYRGLVAAARELPCAAAILDGEAVVQDERGVSDFHALRRAIEGDDSSVVFWAFDLLHLNGEDLRSASVEERRARLCELIDGGHGPIQFSDHFEGDVTAFLAAAEAAGLEGIVSKRKGSRYRSGESRRWLKTKCEVEAEYVVVGAEPNPGGAPYALLAREEPEGLVYAGAAFVTLSADQRERFWTRSELLKIKRPVPTAGLDTRKRKVSWFKPEMRVRVKAPARRRHAAARSAYRTGLISGAAGQALTVPKCLRCDSTGWVCEAHDNKPWDGPHACGCGAPGDPCPDCNGADGAEPPRLPRGTKVTSDKNGWRQ